MKILLITDSYPPEVRSAAVLMQELAEGLNERGHEVTVCTLMPRYNLAAEVSRGGRFWYTRRENGILLIRVNSLPVHKTSVWVRGVSELTLPLAFLAGSMLGPKPDVIAVYSPPLTLGLTAGVFKYLGSTPFIFNVQDLFPQHLIDFGIMKNPIIINFFKGMEKLVYTLASKIAVHSEGNHKYLLEKRGVPQAKLVTLPNWVDTELPHSARILGFRKKWGLEGKFILFFGGVMGLTQGLEVVIQAAEKLKDIEDIVFLLVGDGMAHTDLKRQVKEKGLTNVIFKPFVTPTEYWSVLKEVDVGIMTLSPEVKTPVVPSKMLGFMAAAKPFIAAVNRESDAISIAQASGGGQVVTAGDSLEFAEAVRHLYRDRQMATTMGKQGRQYALDCFSKANCLDRYEQILKELQVPAPLTAPS